MNEVILIGRLTRDPELNEDGTPRCKFTLAIDREKYNGEDRGTDFIRVTTWSGLAEICGKYLKQGSMVAVVGQIRTERFKNRNDENVFVMEIVADKVRFLSKKES